MNEKSILIFGAGKIGRSFIGQLFGQSGYQVVFVSYPVVIKGKTEKTILVQNVRAVSGIDSDAIKNEIAQASVMAVSVGMEGSVVETPIPNGMVWNMVYYQKAKKGTIPKTSHDELWSRLQYFLDNIVPVAKEAEVKMAAHPDDPPMPYVRNTSRLVYQPHMYQRLLDLYPSNFNNLELCLGSIAKMTEGDVYEAIDRYSKRNKIAYIHFRNVIGKVPHYKEVFIDEGDIDIFKVLDILKKNGFDSVLIPDHTPQMSCEGSWYAGMAYAMGYMKEAIDKL